MARAAGGDEKRAFRTLAGDAMTEDPTARPTRVRRVLVRRKVTDEVPGIEASLRDGMPSGPVGCLSHAPDALAADVATRVRDTQGSVIPFLVLGDPREFDAQVPRDRAAS